ncbi:MAG TPA: bifunctional hydroxymethylpyrimidine kinase/phosphomethylpyrimidine kinase [Campylobacterales bacterium]|nr:bifunctional hydroxymethylpyrimidine kinase/phosphomethylpyrimidine kinase [Campylobacterales bacterium]
MHSSYTPTVLTIAGSDPYGGAGIQADIKTIHANGGYAFSATTALTAQNSQGVRGVNIVDASIVQSQIEAILDDIQIDALKIGMLGSKEIVQVVIDSIKKYKLKNIVLDTVIISSSGKRLLDKSALDIFISQLVPIVDIITPNLLEINTLTNSKFEGKENEIDSISQALFDIGAKSALIKGGHFQNQNQSIDILIQPNKDNEIFNSPRIDTTHTHGTGCTLSSAIATCLAQGKDLTTSIKLAKDYLTKSLKLSNKLKFNYKYGFLSRTEPLNHFS